MPFIGKKPTAAPLTSSDVADGIITNAKLAQDIISAETALGATPADTDEFLVSDAGTLKRMDYSHIKGGGAWSKLLTTTCSSVAEVDFNSTYITSTYQDYCVVISGANHSSDDVKTQIVYSTNNGSSLITANYSSITRGYNEGQGAETGSQENTANIVLTAPGIGNATGECLSAVLYFYGLVNDTDSYPLMSGTGAGYKTDGTLFSFYVAGTTENTAGAINFIRFRTDAGNWATGKFTLYGRAA